MSSDDVDDQVFRYAMEGPANAEHSPASSEFKGVGLQVHALFRQLENACEAESLSRLPSMGMKAPACFEYLGRALILLDAFSSCAWGCKKGDHVLERLVGRATNQGRAAIRLTLSGFYDEALVLIRSVGEIANLLSLFESQPGEFSRWKILDERTRRKEFAPFKVRDALQAIGTPIQVSAQVYGELSGRNVHVNPETAPQTYNISSRPLGGGYYQEAGFLLCENELAVVLTFVIYSAARLADLAPEKSMQMLIAGRDLISSTGSIGIGNISTMWDDIKKGRSRP